MKKNLALVSILILVMTGCTTATHNNKTERSINSQKVKVDLIKNEMFSGNPENGNTIVRLDNVLNSEEILVNGVYTSKYHGYQLQIPSVFGNNEISVYQSLISSRPDGTPITSHVKFISQQGHNVAGLVVTRLREDRPKDSQSVLSRFKPKNQEELENLKKAGIYYDSYDKNETVEILQRTIENRVYTPLFPYLIAVQESTSVNSLGASRYFVKGKFFYEFFVLVLNDSSLHDGESFLDAANKQLDILMSSMKKYAQ